LISDQTLKRLGQAGSNGKALFFWCPKKLETFLLAHLTHKIVKNGIELRMLWPQSRHGQELKNKPSNATKASFQTPKRCFYKTLGGIHLLLEF
jgi:hypothetical protein